MCGWLDAINELDGFRKELLKPMLGVIDIVGLFESKDVFADQLVAVKDLSQDISVPVVFNQDRADLAVTKEDVYALLGAFYESYHLILPSRCV